MHNRRLHLTALKSILLLSSPRLSAKWDGLAGRQVKRRPLSGLEIDASMIRTIFAALLLLTSTACAQSVQYEKVEDFDLVYLMNRVEVVGKVNSDDLIVRVLRVGNLPGSADSESGEITHTVYVGVSEYDELPEQSLFKLPDLLAPALERSATEEGAPVLFLTYGPAKDRNMLEITASISELEIEEMIAP